MQTFAFRNGTVSCLKLACSFSSCVTMGHSMSLSAPHLKTGGSNSGFLKGRGALGLPSCEHLVSDDGGCYYLCRGHPGAKGLWLQQRLAVGLWLEDSVCSPLWSEGILGQEKGALDSCLTSVFGWVPQALHPWVAKSPALHPFLGDAQVGYWDEHDQGWALD